MLSEQSGEKLNKPVNFQRPACS